MPEMPEVSAFKAYMDAYGLNKKIDNVFPMHHLASTMLQHISVDELKEDLVGDSFTHINRLGKYLIIALAGSKKRMIIHFGLSGFVRYAKNQSENIPFSKIAFVFDDGSVMHFCDLRGFGKLWSVDKIDQVNGLKNMGPEALDLTHEAFNLLIKKNRQKNIKALLMDQSVIAGIGNEYSDEILFQAGIDPHHKAIELSVDSVERLYNCMIKVLMYARDLMLEDIRIMIGNKLFSDEGKRTFDSSYLQAHRHGDRRCPKNKEHVLKKDTIAGRTSYYCPIDQK